MHFSPIRQRFGILSVAGQTPVKVQRLAVPGCCSIARMYRRQWVRRPNVSRRSVNDVRLCLFTCTSSSDNSNCINYSSCTHRPTSHGLFTVYSCEWDTIGRGIWTVSLKTSERYWPSWNYFHHYHRWNVAIHESLRIKSFFEVSGGLSNKG